MRKYLKKLQDKPDNHKQKIAHTMALVATGAVVLVWLFVRFAIAPKDSVHETREEIIPSSGLNSVLSEIGLEFSKIGEGFSETRGSMNEIFKEIEEIEMSGSEVSGTQNKILEEINKAQEN